MSEQCVFCKEMKADEVDRTEDVGDCILITYRCSGCNRTFTDDYRLDETYDEEDEPV